MKSGANDSGNGHVRNSSGDNAVEQSTGLPILRTWPAVYIAVLFFFAVYVLLLVVLERMFP